MNANHSERTYRLRIATQDFVPLLHQLEMQLRAGVTADAALQLFATETKGAAQFMLGTIAAEVVRGVPIHVACQRFPRQFPPHVAAVIAAGEASASLPTALQALADHLMQQDELRRTALRAFIYPLIVLAATGGVLVFLLGSVVPKFAAIFVSMHLELPALTSGLIAASDFIAAHWRGLLIGEGTAVAGAVFATRFALFRKVRDWILLHVPICGEIVRCLATARFAAHCRLLHDAGVPLLRSLDTVAELVNHASLADQLRAAKERIAAGAPLYASLPRHHDFPSFLIPALKAGETTGQLSEALRQIEIYAAQRAKHRLTAALALLEPLLLTGLTLVVGTIVLSFFLPLFSLLGGISAH